VSRVAVLARKNAAAVWFATRVRAARVRRWGKSLNSHEGARPPLDGT
jgi:hypothetical protein